jgi:type IV pilus assembly protein PilC
MRIGSPRPISFEARMLFSSRLSLASLIELCRVLRHYMGAGLSLLDVFRQQARSGPAAVRPVAGRIVAALEGGDSFQQALKREGDVFPPLLLALAGVGEQTGMLPEVFSELERYFQRQLSLRKQFLAQATWPMVQFVLATFVLAGMIFLLGILTSGVGPTGKPFDPLGLGLTGTSGALIFLGIIWGTVFGLAGLYLFLKRRLAHRGSVDLFLLGLPVLGPCLRALALARFCLALRLTTETGMPIKRAMRLSLRATGNSAFEAQSAKVEEAISAGEELTPALERTRLFPDEFLRILAVAEESGRLHDVMKHQADHYHEESSRRLAALTAVAGYGVWAVVAVFIIVAVFRIFLTYIKMLDAVQ